MTAEEALDQVFREQWSRVLAVLVGLIGDVDVAEEAAQDAFAVAAERWPREGPPTNPAAWLVTTARNRAIDRVRRDRTLAAKTALLRAWRQVALNHAAAVAEVEGPATGLELVDRLPLQGYRYFHATRADLLRRLGRTREARDEYTRALAVSVDETERQFLQRRLREEPPG